MYKYKLNKEAADTPSVKAFQQDRLRGFDQVSDLMAQLQVLLDDARKDTEQYYKDNPSSYDVVYGTDLAVDYLQDIIAMFKGDEE